MPNNQNPVFTDGSISGDGTEANPLAAISSVERFGTNEGFYTNSVESPPAMVEGAATVLTGIATQEIPADGTYVILIWANVDLQPGAAATEIDFSINLDSVPQGVNFARFAPTVPGSVTSIPIGFQATVELSGDGNTHEIDLVATSLGDDSAADLAALTMKVLKV